MEQCLRPATGEDHCEGVLFGDEDDRDPIVLSKRSQTRAGKGEIVSPLVKVRLLEARVDDLLAGLFVPQSRRGELRGGFDRVGALQRRGIGGGRLLRKSGRRKVKSRVVYAEAGDRADGDGRWIFQAGKELVVSSIQGDEMECRVHLLLQTSLIAADPQYPPQ